MDRLLTWDDLVLSREGHEGATLPPELRHEVRERERLFIMDQQQRRDLPPLLLIRFVANHLADEVRSVVLRESDLFGSIGANVDSILAACPEDRPDLLVMRGTL